MKRLNKVTAAVLASTISAAAFIVPSVASAELSANIGVSNMYLWRGTNLSLDGGVVSGGLDYSHESGAYAGMWTTSETDGHETDLYVGFGGEVGAVSYDISYWAYLYPEDDKIADGDISEVIVSLGTGPVTATAYISADEGSSEEYNYYTLSAEMGAFSATYGIWDDSSYSHVTGSYAATDELAFSISVAMEDEGTVEEDPLFAVSYTKSFEIK